MAYNYSQIDKDNLQWFTNDKSKATLLKIEIVIGQVRSLGKLELDFHYPITAIAGKNGSGKSTVLALAACAYHNKKDGFKLKDRKKSYYTFSDFFIQTEKEIPLEGIEIKYSILHNKGQNSERNNEGTGIVIQERKKKKGGRWNDYSKRVNRTVVYLGIGRIVPHSEKANSGSYLKSFKNITNPGKEDEVRDIVSRILDRNYSNLEFFEGSRNNLATVEHKDIYYSGFNMGAGEHSLFELISLLYIVEKGSLILIDEIELGLHENAQSKLISEIKKICKLRQIQIICTSHSSSIIDSIPPEGRIFLEFQESQTVVIPKVSSNYATGKLSGKNNKILDILVEDEVAQLIIEAALDSEIRKQVNIIPIGSHSAVMRHLGARFIERNYRNNKVCVLLDGDCSSAKEQQFQNFKNALEQKHNLEIDLKKWCEDRLSFLPGNTYPEKWIVSQKTNEMFKSMYDSFEIDEMQAKELLEKAQLAGKHNEFYKIAEELALDIAVVSFALVKGALNSHFHEKQRINEFIKKNIDTPLSEVERG